MPLSNADNDIRYVPEENLWPGDFCSIAHESRYEWAAQQFPLKNKKILDFGCGSGYGSHFLANSAASVLGVDISSQAINFANGKYAGTASNLHFQVADLTKISTKSDLQGKFDVVVSFDVIEHLEKYWIFLENIQALLANNGVVVIGCPNRLRSFCSNQKVWNPFHMQEFTPAQFHWLLKHYFQDVQIFGQNFKNGMMLPNAESMDSIFFHARQIAKFFLPEQIVNKIKEYRSTSASYVKYQTKDMVFEKLDLTDRKQCARPFGLVAVCSIGVPTTCDAP